MDAWLHEGGGVDGDGTEYGEHVDDGGSDGRDDGGDGLDEITR